MFKESWMKGREIKMEKLTVETINTDGAVNLAIAIVKSTCDEYMSLLRKLRKDPYNRDAKIKLDCLQRLMHKRPFTAFCLFEPDALIKNIEEQFEKNNGSRVNNRTGYEVRKKRV